MTDELTDDELADVWNRLQREPCKDEHSLIYVKISVLRTLLDFYLGATKKRGGLPE